jgi:hypothetical protein
MKEEQIVFNLFLKGDPDRFEWQKLKIVSVQILQRRMITIEKLYRVYTQTSHTSTLQQLLRVLKYTLEDIEADGDSIYDQFVEKIREFILNITVSTNQPSLEQLFNINHILSQIDVQGNDVA